MEEAADLSVCACTTVFPSYKRHVTLVTCDDTDSCRLGCCESSDHAAGLGDKHSPVHHGMLVACLDISSLGYLLL